MLEKRSPLAALVLAGVAAVAAGTTWIVGVFEAREIAAACNHQYALLAELADCRMPALYGAVSWLLFVGAIASAWVAGVRASRNSSSASDRGRSAPPDAQPST